MILRRHKSTSYWLVAASLLVVAGVSRAAEQQSPADAETPWAYRRIFVPADKLDAWPREGDKFIPVEAAEFEALVAAANKSADKRELTASIDVAEYWATLEDDGRFHGRGKWTISARDKKSTFLQLSGPSLVPLAPHWQGDPQEPVRLGAWGLSNQAADRDGLHVQRSGALEFEWTIPTALGHDPLEIPWRVPAATAQRLTLDLPDTMVPALGDAAVLESTPIEPNRRRWLLATTSLPEATLRIATRTSSQTQPAARSAYQLTLRESATYRVEPRSIEIEFTWDLEDAVGDRRELSVPLPRGLQIMSVKTKDDEVDWRIERGAETETNRVIIALPTADKSGARQIIVNAWHPLVLDRPWQLPVLRPDGAFWSSGTVELSVAPELELESMVPLESAQIGASNIGGFATGPEVYSLIEYSQAANVEVTIGRREPVATLRIGSSLVVADQDVTGRLVTEWSVAHSGLHQLSGELASGWNVETVETIPSGALAEWFIDRRGNRRTLEVELTDAARPERRVTVIIMARLQRFSLAEPIPTDTLKMVHWSASRVAQHLLSFQSSEPFAAETVGNLPIASRESISEADRLLLDSAADDQRIVDLTRAGRGAGLQLTFQRGTYTAEVEFEATCSVDEMALRYHIIAEPQSNAVDRLYIYSTVRLPANTHWVEKSTGLPLTAERLPDDDAQRKDLPPDGDLWLVRLTHPTAELIEVLATATSPWQKRGDVPLIALPGAIEQRGHVIIRCAVNSIPAVESAGLVPTSRPIDNPAAVPTGESALIRAAYRYDPAECLRSPRRPRLSIGPEAKTKSSSIVVRELKLDTYCWPDGRTTHRANFQLENFGANEFTPGLPPDAKLTAYAVNGQTLGVPYSAGSRVLASIRLPPHSEATTVTLYFENQQSPLATGRSIAPPMVQNGIPILAGEWTVWLPEEFALGTDEASEQWFDWRQRLFGPLARAYDVPPFRPFHLDDWARLLNGVGDWFSIRSSNAAPLRSSEQTTSDATTLVMAGSAPSAPADMASHASALTSHVAEAANKSDGVLPGWRAFRQKFVADGSPVAVVVLHPPATTGWAVALLLVAFVFGRQLCRRRSVILLVLTGLAACSALVLPPAFAPLATGVLWGLVFACVIEWPRQLLSIDRVERGNLQVPIFGTLVFVAACGLTRCCLAEPIGPRMPALPVTNVNKIERVLIPVDSARQPTGSKYYVSDRFLRELLSTQTKQASGDNQWLLAGASYMGELQASRDRADAVAGKLALTFTIETFGRDTTVVLPLTHSQAEWQSTAMLDGVPLTLDWRKAGGCAAEIAQPGRYALTIYCVPKTSAMEGRNKFRLTVPKIGSAAIELHSPTALSGITIPGADLVRASQDAPGTLSGTIGATGQFAVDWPRLAAKNGTQPGANVTALSWLHVGAESTELETKFMVDGDARRPDSLTITFDERWEPITDSQPVGEVRVGDVANGRRSLTVSLPTTDSGRQEVSLRWQLTSARPVGAFQLPLVELSSISASQRWFAVSADASLECSVDDKSATSATANEFLAKWGGSPDATPQVVVANFDSARGPTLTVRPRASESTVREVLHVALGAKEMRVAYHASISPGALSQYQFRLSAPPELEVDDILVMSERDRIPVRWARDASNHINVFFGKKAASDYRVMLAATMPSTLGEPHELPRIAAATSASATQQLQLYRDDDVQVSLHDLPAPDGLGAGLADLPPVQWLIRPLGVFHVDETAAATARVTVTSDEPQLTADSVITLSRETSGWWVTYGCRPTVQSGELDVLRLRVPAGWSGPFEFESSVPVTSELVPLDERHQTLTIRLTNSISNGGHFDLRIRGPLAMSAGTTPSLPDITFATPTDGRRYAIVPRTADSELITWTETGVRPAEVSTNLLPATFDATKQRQLEIVNEQFRVAVIPRALIQAVPRVRLADTSISIGHRGGRIVTTRLVLTSDGLAECLLQLPADDKLVSIKLDGQPALHTPLDTTRSRIVLGAANLPQLLEIVSRSGNRQTNGSSRELRRPTLLAGNRPIPVEVSLWTIAEPPKIIGAGVAAASPVSSFDQAALRLDRLAGIVEGAGAAAADAPAPDGENWFRAWAPIVRDVLAQTARLRAQPISGPAVAQVSRSSEEQLDQAEKRLDTWLEFVDTQLDSDAATAGGSQQRFTSNWAAPSVADATVSYYVAEGGAEGLTVPANGTSAARWPTRTLPIVVIASLVVMMAWLIRSPAAADYLCRWPHTIGVALGLLWWAWLWPSWLGLVIVAGSVWLSLRFDWPGRSFRAEASTVLRSTRTL